MSRRWVRAGLVGVTIWCNSALASAQCATDLECKGDRICENGSCIAAPPSTSGPVVAPAPAAPAAPPIAAGTPPSPPLVRRSRALIAGGIAMTTTGTIFIILALLGNSEAHCPKSEPMSDVVVRCRHDPSLSIYTLGITGVMLTGAGIPMFVYGAERVRPKPSTRAAIMPWLTPNAAGLRLRLDL